ncbi:MULTISPECIES: guanylate kinase [Carboxydothermus]|uniref:Guanylate kinase n=2 Tax=Carboxydothermus TaxID=129957 RepID=KGUA_CARHZ|nr:MULTISPECIES: guanylate kinase [Carboxydothermus]Q3AC14.1 RecName: Full=Guanylate kinase; AltName: Full=GMP kinase [Carboxydothermus hydrogenoformans Z-2901]ABB15039.1 guanylate kinase [Carboxydothermus hydrogenoformans Z-2901]NYE58258.1 guanylate kinase [Carboxydothermus ferrireducens DSM 11255]
MHKGMLVVVSGPSGAGKGTICQEIRKRNPNLFYSISATTREKRVGEIDGVHYYFIDRQQFEKMIANDEFLEWADVYGNYYGTPKKPVFEALARGQDVILEIDIKGARQVKKTYPEGVFVFILPPSISILEERLRKRGTDKEEIIVKRMQMAWEEIANCDWYDYLILNDDLETAVNDLEAVLTAEKLKPKRVNYRVLLEGGVLER